MFFISLSTFAACYFVFRNRFLYGFMSIYNFCIYKYICQDGGILGFVDFTKLSFALSSLAQPFDQMGGIPEYGFIILSLCRKFSQRNS